MKMTKNKSMSLAAVAIVIIVFSVVVFVLPFSRYGGFWVGYGFSMLAMLLTAAVGLYALGHEGMKSKFYGMPLLSVAWIYLVVQIILSFIEMVIPSIPTSYGIVINVVLLGACLIGLIGVNIAKEEIERIDEKVKEKVFYIKSLQTDVESLLAKTMDESLKKAIKELADTIRYSDPMSSTQLASIENKIEAKASALADSLEDTDTARGLCDELQQLFAERNRKCKQLK